VVLEGGTYRVLSVGLGGRGDGGLLGVVGTGKFGSVSGRGWRCEKMRRHCVWGKEAHSWLMGWPRAEP